MEEFRKIEEFEYYSISNLGRVRNDKTYRILKSSINSNGYEYITIKIYTNKIPKTYLRYIHRLMAIAFIPNEENKQQIDHINGNKVDNRLENLRWVTISENRHAYGYELSNLHRQKKITATNIDGRKLEFNSRNEAAKYFKCDKSQISYGRYYKKGNKKNWKFELS